MSTPRDPYQVLGLARTATAEEIKQAYRRLAKQYHPDLNPGQPEIERRFKEVTSAYDLLSDSNRRARFDRGEIDANGNERPGSAFHSYSAGSAGFDPIFDDTDIFSEFFETHRYGAGLRSRGSDIAYSVTIPFVEAARGTRRRISLSTGKSLDVIIPPGTEDQQKLRLKGQGMEGTGGSPAGDAIVEVHVEPHPFFTRRDLDIHLDLPVTLPEAVLGATVTAPTLDGHVALKIPKGSNTDTVLRLKGKGIAEPRSGRTGDQYLRLKVMLPNPADEELSRLVEQWARDRDYDVRRKVFG